ncbi:hypothetical protein J4G37_13245 [Microvirga sp. 3-52]|nr:hypothetical protein [Microvirga sp. 3-52]
MTEGARAQSVRGAFPEPDHAFPHPTILMRTAESSRPASTPRDQRHAL